MKGDTATALRTPETWEAYQKRRKELQGVQHNFMAHPEPEQVKLRFKYWFIMRNDFPYDVVAETHDMLVLKREGVTQESQIEEWEWQEFEEITQAIDRMQQYDCIVKNFTVGQSHPSHIHWHLITWKRLPSPSEHRA